MPRSKELNKQMRDRRREAIIRKSLRLFAYDGYDSLTIDGIAEACHCSHGLFYYYFKSKEELFNAVMETYGRKCYKVSDEIGEIEKLHGLQAAERIIKATELVLSVGGEPLMYCRLEEVRRSASTIDEKTRASLTGIDTLPLLTRVFRECQAEGILQNIDPEGAVRFFLDWFTGISYRRIRFKGEKFETPDIMRMFRLLKNSQRRG